MSNHFGFLEVVKAGGLTLALLAAASVYCFALIWQRWVVYKRATGGLDAFLRHAKHQIEKGQLKELMAHCRQHQGPASAVVLASLTGHEGLSERRAATERVLEREVALLEKGLPVLGTVGSVAPFVGLFGTVMGVMRAFRDLAGAANAGPGVVAVGIAEALVGTAAGLFVAIPAVLAYNYFTTRANRFQDEMRWLVDDILERLTAPAR
ncbi:MAG: MotA/TolQ/ExbB proton channel family protein [Elusimicrobia bacterium]|nr:MotA/TolQ/ExbB proton channel family protein [Elusimicrobiota bacterium]